MEKSRRVESFPPNLLMSKKLSFDYSAAGAYILPQPSKITKKKPKSKVITRDKFGRKPKSDKKESKR